MGADAADRSASSNSCRSPQSCTRRCSHAGCWAAPSSDRPGSGTHPLTVPRRPVTWSSHGNQGMLVMRQGARPPGILVVADADGAVQDVGGEGHPVLRAVGRTVGVGGVRRAGPSGCRASPDRPRWRLASDRAVDESAVSRAVRGEAAGPDRTAVEADTTTMTPAPMRHRNRPRRRSQLFMPPSPIGMRASLTR